MNLVAARARKFWTQEEAAAKLGVGVSSLQRWENGTAKPYKANIQRLCTTYEATAAELGLDADDKPEAVMTSTHSATSQSVKVKEPRAFIGTDLTMQLLALAFVPYRSYQDLQKEMVHLIYEHNSMNTNNQNYHTSKNEALSRLATLPIVTFNLDLSSGSPSPQVIAEILTQCAASIAACWELSKSTEHSDLRLAFTCVSAYLPTLKAIVQDAALHRKHAASLVFQGLQLKARMAYHMEGPKQAAGYAEQAVTYAEESGNLLMQIVALRELASAYEWATDHRREQALHVTEKARYLIEHPSGLKVPFQVQSWVYSGLAKYQALNGKPQEVPILLEKALETFSASSNSENESIPGFVNHTQAHLLRYKGMTYAYLGQQDKALNLFAQAINLDDDHISARLSMPARTHVGIISEATFASLKVPKVLKDKDLSIKLWKAGMEKTTALQSETYFSESYLAYQIMECIWDDPDVRDLRDLIKHW